MYVIFRRVYKCVISILVVNNYRMCNLFDKNVSSIFDNSNLILNFLFYNSKTSVCVYTVQPLPCIVKQVETCTCTF